MWSVAGIKAANADYLAKQEQEPLRRAREELDRIAELKNSGVVKPRSNTKERNMFRNSSPGNSPTVPVKPIPKPYGVNSKSITGLLKGLNIHRYDDTNGLERFDSLRISSSGNSPTVHVETIPNPDKPSNEMESNTPRPELDQSERPIHKPLYGGKKRKSKRMKSRYRKKYKGTRNNKTRRYIK